MTDNGEQMRESRTLRVPAPADAFWEVVADFAGMLRWWPGGIDAVTAEGEGQGMIRTLHIAGGRTVSERLVLLDPVRRVMELELLDGRPAFMRRYFCRYEVAPDGTGSVLTWSPRCEVDPGAGDSARAYIDAGWKAVGGGLCAWGEAHPA